MNHFIDLKDISTKNLRKILIDAKNRKKQRKNLSNLEIDKAIKIIKKVCSKYN